MSDEILTEILKQISECNRRLTRLETKFSIFEKLIIIIASSTIPELLRLLKLIVTKL